MREPAGGVPGGAAAERGQALVIGVLALGLLLLLMLVGPGLAVEYAQRAGVQSAADAAALACAAQATITQYVDARGTVYRTTVAVDPSRGPPAAGAAWSANLQRWPVRTVSFVATPAGADCTVQAVVQSALPMLDLLSPRQREPRWTARAEARAYGTPTPGA